MGRVDLQEVIKIIETTPIPAGVNPIGTEWLIGQMRKKLIAAVVEVAE